MKKIILRILSWLKGYRKVAEPQSGIVGWPASFEHAPATLDPIIKHNKFSGNAHQRRVARRAERS